VTLAITLDGEKVERATTMTKKVELTMTSRRHVLLGMGTLASVWLTGCASGQPRSPEQSRTYCLKNIRSMRTICTPERIPSADVEAEAKRFESAPGLLTVFVVRWNWTDSVRPLLLTLDGSTQVGTLPKSLVRLRLTPGDHIVAFEWDGKTRRHAIRGGAGEVRFVELTGSSFPTDPSYEWSDIDPAGAQVRARKSRLIADIQPA
jgi:hypothetical protein